MEPEQKAFVAVILAIAAAVAISVSACCWCHEKTVTSAFDNGYEQTMAPGYQHPVWTKVQE